MTGSQRIPDTHIPSDTDETHMENAGRTGQYVTRAVHIAPCQAKWPVALKNTFKMFI